MKKYSLLFSLLILFTLNACGGRIPSTSTAQDIVKGYFTKYGKKYPQTMFGGHKVQNVDILSMEEIQRHLSYGTAVVTLDDSNAAKINMNFLYKAPFGWRQQGWEMVSNTSGQSQVLSTPVELPESGIPPSKKPKKSQSSAQ